MTRRDASIAKGCRVSVPLKCPFPLGMHAAPSNKWFLWPHESAFQTPSRLAQPFFRACSVAHGCDQHTDTRNVDLRRSCLCYACDMRRGWPEIARNVTRSSAIAEGPRDASCQLKSCQLARDSAETTYTTSHDQIDGMKLEI